MDKTDYKLWVNWSKKENDIMIHFPRKRDGHYISLLFNNDFIKEMESRGYDITTIKFSIKRKQNEINQPA